MERQPVSSSQIKSIGHDPSTSKMHIEFNNGAVYEYDDVSPKQHADLINAPSIGSHFTKHVKHSFTYRRIGDATRSGAKIQPRHS